MQQGIYTVQEALGEGGEGGEEGGGRIYTVQEPLGEAGEGGRQTVNACVYMRAADSSCSSFLGGACTQCMPVHGQFLQFFLEDAVALPPSLSPPEAVPRPPDGAHHNPETATSPPEQVPPPS